MNNLDFTNGIEKPSFLLLLVHLGPQYIFTYIYAVHKSIGNRVVDLQLKSLLVCRIVITAATILVTKLVMDKVTVTQMVATVLGCLAVLMVYQNEILGSSIDFPDKVKYSENNTSTDTVTKNRTFLMNQEDRFHCTIDEDDLCNSVKGTFNLEINGTGTNKAYDSHKNRLARCYEETAYYLMIGIGLAIACGLCNTSKYKGIGGFERDATDARSFLRYKFLWVFTSTECGPNNWLVT